MGLPADEILRPYRDAVAEHGAGFEATLWGSRFAQQLRFQVMIDLAGFQGCTVVDVGCGTGDLAAALLEHDVAYARYVGIDALPEVVEAARARDLPRSAFEAIDVVTRPEALITAAGDAADWFCFSGTLNTMDDETARALITACFERAGQGVVFNFLSDRPHPRWRGRDLAPARRFDTLGWIRWSLDQTSRVAFTQDYLDGHDATICLRHDDTPSAP